MLFFKKDPITIRNYIWNIISGLVNASEAIIIVSFVSWKFGDSAAGIMAIAFTIANVLLQIGGIGLKPYQISHYNDISFRSFHRFRARTVMIMIILSAVYSLIFLKTGVYNAQKTAVILLVCLWYAVEAYEDIFSSQLHAAGMLYIGRRIFTARWVCLMLTFVAVSILTDNLIISCATSLAVSVAVLAILLKSTDTSKLYHDKGKDTQIRTMLISNISVILIGFMCIILSSLPKYIMDFVLDSEKVAIYSYLFLPVFGLELLSGFIYQPRLPEYTKRLLEGRIDEIRHMIKVQIAMITGLAICAALGVYLFGIPILSVIYHTDLSAYRTIIVLHTIAGSSFAVGTYLSTILILDRGQNISAIIHGIIIASGVAVHYFLIKQYEITGAAFAFLIVTIAYAAVFAVCLSYHLKQRNAEPFR